MEENRIGREIAKQRFSRSLSRDGLSLHTGISAERLAALERGEALPDAAELSSLAEFFGVSADQLLGIAKTRPNGRSSDRIFGMTLCALSLFAYVLFFAVRRSVCRAADLVFLFLRAAAAGMEIAIWFSLDSGAYPAGAPEWMFSVGLGLNTLSMAYIALFYKNVFEEKRPNTVAIVLFSILFFFRMYFSVFVFILAEYVLYTEIADIVLLFGLYFLKADRERFQEIESKKKAQKRKNKGRFSAR